MNIGRWVSFGNDGRLFSSAMTADLPLSIFIYQIDQYIYTILYSHAFFDIIAYPGKRFDQKQCVTLIPPPTILNNPFADHPSSVIIATDR